MKSTILFGLTAALTLVAGNASAAATDSIVFQDFGDHAGQNSLAAAKGVADSGKSWVTGGWWYYFGSTGTALKDGTGRTANDSIKWLWTDSLLHAKFTIPNDATGDIYLGLGTGIIGDGSKSYDLTGLTSVNIVAKGTGTIRFKWDTKDELDATLADTWGTYGFSLALTSAWKTFSIPLASFTGSQYSALATSKQTLAHGLTAVYKAGFQVSDTTDADLYLKSIVFKGLALSSVVETGKKTGIIAKSAEQELSSAVVRDRSLDLSLVSASVVAVYDLAGNSVLSFGRLSAGTHTVSLAGLKSGAYIARISGKSSEKAFPIQVIGR
jgi:hypothetical protein